MRLGFAVKVLGWGGLPSHDARRWQSEPHLRVSIEHLHAVFDYLEEMDIDMYRMSSNLAPYLTHPDLPQFRGQVEECVDELAELGARAMRRGLRLTTHPGQYTVLNSENPDVVDQALHELDYHASLMDAMGLPAESVVNLHIGGMTGGREAAVERFLRGFERLSERAQDRLVIENDDRTFSLADVLPVCERIGRPVVWDILHHHCHDPEGIPDREALQLAIGTWPQGVTPKIHFSSPKTVMEERRKRVGRRVERSLVMPPLRVHADLVDPVTFEQFLLHTAHGLEFDAVLEAKGKDLALLRLREQLEARGVLPPRPPRVEPVEAVAVTTAADREGDGEDEEELG